MVPVYFTIPMVTGLATAVLARYVWARRAAPGAREMAGALLATAVWCVCYAMEFAAPTLEQKIFWARMQCPGIAAAPVFALLLVHSFCGHRIGPRARAALFIMPVATQFFHWTNSRFHLYWERVWVDVSGPGPLLARVYGPGFWMALAYTNLCVLGSLFLLSHHLFKRDNQERPITALLMAAFLVPWAAGMLYVFDLLPIKYLDVTPIAFAATGMCTAWVLFRYRFRGIVPVAWSTVVDNMPESVIVLDLLGRIVDVNPAAERMLRLDRIALIGREPSIAFSHRPEFMACALTAEGRGAEARFTEAGRERTCQAEVQPLYTRRGVRIGRLLMVRDVTEERRAARELEESRRAAEEAALAKSRFLANMSHEIRTPMNGILGMAALLGESQLLPEDAESAEAIRGSAESLLRILNDILDFSKMEAGRLELESIDFDLHSVLRDVVRLMEISARAKSLTLEFRWPPDAPRYFTGDPGRLRQVLLNLVGNAVKFTEHGEVTLELHCLERDDRRVRVQITVADTGIGISAGHLKLLFREFSQADSSIARRHGGTGLGLAISHRLVELMQGAITVSSEVGKGTTFRVELWLPLAAQPPLPPQVLQPHQQFPGCRVLLAEDNPVNQRLGVRVLERAACVVEVAANGAEAVRMAGESRYDIVFMDCQMPVMDGFAATAAIRREGHRMPIVALTASALDNTRQSCLAAGMNDFVTKPIEPDTWLKVLEKWAARPGAGIQGPGNTRPAHN